MKDLLRVQWKHKVTMLNSVKNVFKRNNKDIIPTAVDVTLVAGFNVIFKYSTFFSTPFISCFLSNMKFFKCGRGWGRDRLLWDNSNKRCLFLSHENEFYLCLNKKKNTSKLKDYFWTLKYLHKKLFLIYHFKRLNSFSEVKYLIEVSN